MPKSSRRNTEVGVNSKVRGWSAQLPHAIHFTCSLHELRCFQYLKELSEGSLCSSTCTTVPSTHWTRRELQFPIVENQSTNSTTTKAAKIQRGALPPVYFFAWQEISKVLFIHRTPVYLQAENHRNGEAARTKSSATSCPTETRVSSFSHKASITGPSEKPRACCSVSEALTFFVHPGQNNRQQHTSRCSLSRRCSTCAALCAACRIPAATCPVPAALRLHAAALKSTTERETSRSAATPSSQGPNRPATCCRVSTGTETLKRVRRRITFKNDGAEQQEGERSESRLLFWCPDDRSAALRSEQRCSCAPGGPRAQPDPAARTARLQQRPRGAPRAERSQRCPPRSLRARPGPGTLSPLTGGRRRAAARCRGRAAGRRWGSPSIGPARPRCGTGRALRRAAPARSAGCPPAPAPSAAPAAPSGWGSARPPAPHSITAAGRSAARPAARWPWPPRGCAAPPSGGVRPPWGGAAGRARSGLAGRSGAERAQPSEEGGARRGRLTAGRAVRGGAAVVGSSSEWEEVVQRIRPKE